MTDGTRLCIGYTNTGAGTAIKTTSLDYPDNLRKPSSGELLLIFFPNGNTSAAIQLAINGNTEIPVMSASGSIGSFPLIANTALLLAHRGTFLQTVGAITDTPTISALKGVSGDIELSLTSVELGVNHFDVSGAIAGASPVFQAVGDDTNIDANIAAKNGGSVKLRSGTPGSTKQIVVATPDTSPVNFLTIKNSNANSAVQLGVDGTDAKVALNILSKGGAPVYINGVAPLPPGRLLSPGAYVPGGYYNVGPPANPSTSVTLGFGATRTIPLPVAVSLPIAKWYIDLVLAGDAASVFRIGIWNDDGFGRPGTLLLDVGTISTGSGNAGSVATGGVPGLYEITNAITLAPGFYHVGGAVQGSGTQPTLRTESSNIPFAGCLGTTLPSANYSGMGYGAGTMAGALTDATSVALIGTAPRVGIKVGP